MVHATGNHIARFDAAFQGKATTIQCRQHEKKNKETKAGAAAPEASLSSVVDRKPKLHRPPALAETAAAYRSAYFA